MAEGPDQLWSWVVAFACFFISFIMYGLYRATGIFLVAFIAEFGESRENSSWPIFLLVSTQDLTGLIVGPLGQKIGIRPIVISGSIVSAMGMSLCFFASSLTFLTVFFGFTCGLGYGLTATLTTVIVNEYFLKYRVTANGIANSGICFGSIVFPTVYEYLLSTYGFNGGLLLTGGILLHMAIAGVLMKPPPWKHKKHKRYQNSKAVTGTRADEANGCLLHAENGKEMVESLALMNERCATKDDALVKKSVLQTQSIHSQTFSNVLHCPLAASESNDVCSNEKKSGNGSVSLKVTSSCDNTTNMGITEDNCGRQQPARARSYSEPCDQRNEDNGVLRCSEESNILKHSLSPRVEIYQQKLAKRPSRKTSGKRCPSPTENPSADCKELRGHLSVLKTNVNGCISKTDGPRDDCKECRGQLSISKSFRILFTSPMFYFITLTNVVFYTCDTMFFVTNADFCRDKNVPEEDVSVMIVLLSVCDLAGRLCFGWVTDLKFLSRSNIVALCFLVQGLVHLGFSVVEGFWMLMVLNGFFGLTLGIVTVITCVLPVDYLHEEIQEVAFGAIAFSCGLVSLGCSTVIGHFRDNKGSYANIFYLMSAFSTMTAAFWIFEKYFAAKTPTPMQPIPVPSHHSIR